MSEATRQFYGSIALLFVFIAGVFGGVLWGRPWDDATSFAAIVLVIGVVVGWIATIDSAPRSNG